VDLQHGTTTTALYMVEEHMIRKHMRDKHRNVQLASTTVGEVPSLAN